MIAIVRTRWLACVALNALLTLMVPAASPAEADEDAGEIDLEK
jgi:hypothetical protein